MSSCDLIFVPWKYSAISCSVLTIFLALKFKQKGDSQNVAIILLFWPFTQGFSLIF